ncbi:MAG: hypothetical protein AB2L14_28440 [Candidatus Xenobiia bacterium LiM19]
MRIKLICSTLALFLILAGSAWSSFTSLPPSALLAESDLVVLGTLKDLHVIKKSGEVRIYGGALQVEKVLAGNAELTDGAVAVRWTVVYGLSSSFNPEDLNQKRGVWLLTLWSGDEKGEFFTADHPGRFLLPDQLASVQSLLEKPFYRIALESDEYLSGKPIMARFIISTEKDAAKADAYLQVVKGKLIFSGPVEIHIQNVNGEVKRRGRLATASAEPVTVKKGSPHSVEIDLSKSFYLVSEGSYTIWWGSGNGITSPRYTFYIKKPSR